MLRRIDDTFAVFEEFVRSADGDPARMLELADEEVTRSIKSAVEIMAEWHPLDVLAWLQLANRSPAETYQESMEEGLSAVVEMVALVLLSRDAPSETRVLDPSDASWDPPDPRVVADLIRDVQGLMRRILSVSLVRGLAARDDVSMESFVAWRASEREVMLRNPGYPHIVTQHLRSLLSRPTVEELMRAHLGFGAATAFAVLNALDTRLDAAIDGGQAEAARHVRSLIESTDPELTAARARWGSSEKEFLAFYAAAIAEYRLGERAVVSADALADLADADPAEVSAFLAACSQPFQPDLNPHDRLSRFLTGNNGLRLRPILDLGAGRFFLVSPGLLLFGLREILESSIPETFRPHYADEVAAWMEDTAVEALTGLLTPDRLVRNVEYLDIEGNLAELDAVLTVDRVAIAIEAKHVAFSDRARTGDVMRLKRDLGRLVGKTMEQAVRTAESIRQEHKIMLRSGEELPFPEIARVFPVALTLDDVSSLAGTVNDLVEAGLVTFSGTLPWVVNVHDLCVIAEIAEGPAQFLAYLDQHERLVAHSVLSVLEELDVFMKFLNTGIWTGDQLDAEGHPMTRLMVPSQTDELDAYYLHKTGYRTRPAPKPAQKWNPKGFRELMRRIEDARLDGWSTAAINLQSVDAAVRRDIGSDLGRLARRSQADGDVHDKTWCFEQPNYPRTGITLLAGRRGGGIEGARQTLTEYTTLRKYAQQAASWTGLAVNPDKPKGDIVVVQIDTPWIEDQTVEDSVRRAGMTRRQRGIEPLSATAAEISSTGDRSQRHH